MEMYKDYFELCGSMYGTTHFYRCVKKIRKIDIVNIGEIRSLSYRQKADILRHARDKADPLTAQVMKSAAAKCAIDHGQLEEAASLLDSVDKVVAPSHYTLDVSVIVETSFNMVRHLLNVALNQ